MDGDDRDPVVYWMGEPSRLQNIGEQVNDIRAEFSRIRAWQISVEDRPVQQAVKVVADAKKGQLWFWWRSESAKRPWTLLHTACVNITDARGEVRRVAQATIDQWPPFGDLEGELLLAGPL